MDVNLGCPIDYFTSKGLGAALARQPKRVTKIVEAMKLAVKTVPVTVKFRLGWNDSQRNYVELARAAVEGGADALAVHGRTRDARYRFAADWDAIGEVARAVSVPVIGNGDLLFPHEMEAARTRSGCAAVMVSRGALIKPWIFREAAGGTATSRPRSGWPSTGGTWRWRSNTGATTSGLASRWPTSRAGTSGSGAATRRSGRTAVGRACRSARMSRSHGRRSSACSLGRTRRRTRG